MREFVKMYPNIYIIITNMKFIHKKVQRLLIFNILNFYLY